MRTAIILLSWMMILSTTYANSQTTQLHQEENQKSTQQPLQESEVSDNVKEPLSEVVEMLENVSDSEIAETIISFSEFSRFYKSPEAIESQEWLKSQWEQITQNRDDVHIEFFHHTEFSPMPSLILSIQGSMFPEEKIILGAHADSVVKEGRGVMPDEEVALRTNAPGADDNASGIATITEVLRVLVSNNYRPTRTMMFMAYAAEEIGRKGSEHIANSFAESNQKVIGSINLDLVNFKGSEDLDLVMISDYTDPGQNSFLKRVINTYLPTLQWEYDQCGYGCSDHASWYIAGYPASMLTEARLREINPHIHKTTDTFEVSGNNAKHAINFAKLSLAFFVEIDRFGMCRYDLSQCIH